MNQKFADSGFVLQVTGSIRVLSGCVLLLTNILMWVFFTKSLRICSSSVEATITNTAVNFFASVRKCTLLDSFNIRLSTWYLGLYQQTGYCVNIWYTIQQSTLFREIKCIFPNSFVFFICCKESFCLFQGLFGFLLFRERLPPLWWCGASLIVLGLLFLNKGSRTHIREKTDWTCFCILWHLLLNEVMVVFMMSA